LDLADAKLAPMIAQRAPHKRMILRVFDQLAMRVHHPGIASGVRATRTPAASSAATFSAAAFFRSSLSLARWWLAFLT
jgi:hypothetical protein